jgi:EpsI family protein
MASRIEGAGPTSPPVLKIPLAATEWKPVVGRLADWTPHFANPRATIQQVYLQSGVRAGLYVAYYRRQRQGAELITSGNTLAPTTSFAWRTMGETFRVVNVNREKLPVIETQLRGQGRDLLVWHWYWVDGQYSVNPYEVKLLQAKSRLLGEGDDGAIVAVYTEIGATRTDAANVLLNFLQATLPAINWSLGHAD